MVEERMSSSGCLLALVGDRKDIRPQAPITPHGMYFTPFLFLHRHPLCLRRAWWYGVKEDVWRGRVKVKTS